MVGGTQSAVGREWWTIQCRHEYVALRRTRQARELALNWTSAELVTEFRYRGFIFTVQLDPFGQARAWQGMTIVRTEGEGQRGEFTLQSRRGERQLLPGHVFMTMVEEARRGIDSVRAVSSEHLLEQPVNGAA